MKVSYSILLHTTNESLCYVFVTFVSVGVYGALIVFYIDDLEPTEAAGVIDVPGI